jgi:hypothetical protein
MRVVMKMRAVMSGISVIYPTGVDKINIRVFFFQAC